MTKKRIHKDLTIRWRVTTNGEAISLTGRDLRVVLTDRTGRAQYPDFAVSDTNRLTILWKGSDQTALGDYTVTLMESLADGGETAVDAVDFVTLVPFSTMETDGSEDNVETDAAVDLETADLVVGTSGASAYEIWLSKGNTGTEADFLASLKGERGEKGEKGAPGKDATVNGYNTLTIAEGENVIISQQGGTLTISAQGGTSETYDDSELRDLIATKQDTIDDLGTIRSGAQAGATALQPSQVSEVAKTGKYDDLTGKPAIPTVPTQEITANTNARHTHSNKSVLDGITSSKVSAWDTKGSYSKPSGGIPSSDLTPAVQTSLGKADTALQEHQDISGKQDVISDLATIRSGAAKGATALQSVPSTYRTAAAQNTIDATKADKADVYTKSEIDAMIGNVLNTPV